MAGGQLTPLQQMRLQQDKQLIAKYFKTNPEIAHAIVSQGGGNSSLLDQWVTQQYFGGDPNAYKNWINTTFYTGNKSIGYNPQTGQIVDRNSNQVLNPGFQSPLTNYFRYAGYNTPGQQGTPGMGQPLYGRDQYGNINLGVQQGQPGMPGVPNQFEGMQQLFRDNTGMLHDPGDNPVTAPTSPASPPQWWNPFPGAPQQNSQPGYNNNWRQGQMRNPNKTAGVMTPPTPMDSRLTGRKPGQTMSDRGPTGGQPPGPFVANRGGVPGTPPATGNTPPADPLAPPGGMPWNNQTHYNYSQQ